MGKSNSIEQQAKMNQEFQQYIDTQTKALSATTKQARADMDKTIAEYYKSGQWDDVSPVAAKTYQHMTTTSEWSLTSVSQMIDSLRNTIFGTATTPVGGNPTPPADGKVTPPVDNKVPATPSILEANMSQMAHMQTLIATAAFTAIQGMMLAFTAKTETSLQSQATVKELAPGLTLFLCIIENRFKNSTFFTNNMIVQTVYVYDVRFSVQQAGDLAEFNQVQALISEQATITNYINQCNAALKQLTVTAGDFEEKHTRFTKLLNGFNDDLEHLQARIDKLTDQPSLPPGGTKPSNK